MRADLKKMKTYRISIAVVCAASLVFAGCQKPVVSSEDQIIPKEAAPGFDLTQVAKNVEDYRANPSEEQKAKVEESFAGLDAEIQNLRGQIDAASSTEKPEVQRKLVNLENYRSLEFTRFGEANPGGMPEVPEESTGRVEQD